MRIESFTMKRETYREQGYEYLRLGGTVSLLWGSNDVSSTIKLSPEVIEKISDLILADAKKQIKESLK
jgi:hypothetical protein